jgi:hypothetical protein
MRHLRDWQRGLGELKDGSKRLHVGFRLHNRNGGTSVVSVTGYIS